MVDMPESTQGLVVSMSALAHQRQADGAAAFAEMLRAHNLKMLGMVNLAESLGVRHVEESGSGRVRVLDATTSGLQPSK